MAADSERGEGTGPAGGSAGFGEHRGASFLAELGHKVPVALLPNLLTSVSHAPAPAPEADRGHLILGATGPLKSGRGRLPSRYDDHLCPTYSCQQTERKWKEQRVRPVR